MYRGFYQSSALIAQFGFSADWKLMVDGCCTPPQQIEVPLSSETKKGYAPFFCSADTDIKNF